MTVWISPTQAMQAIEKGDGHGVRIAVLDSGIETSHPYFAGRSSTMTLPPTKMAISSRATGTIFMATAPRLPALSGALRPMRRWGSFRVLGSSLSARTAQVSVAARKSIALGYHILNGSFGCGISGHLPLYKRLGRLCLTFRCSRCRRFRESGNTGMARPSFQCPGRGLRLIQ